MPHACLTGRQGERTGRFVSLRSTGVSIFTSPLPLSLNKERERCGHPDPWVGVLKRIKTLQNKITVEV